MNGLAMKDGQPVWTIVVAATDIQDGSRRYRIERGFVSDFYTADIVAYGLSMRHSPRWSQDRLWLLDSGTENIDGLDIPSGRVEQVAFCPGFTRGSRIHGPLGLCGHFE